MQRTGFVAEKLVKMANSVYEHKVQGVLRSLDMVLFHLRVHNSRTAALVETMEEMCKNNHSGVYSAIKNYADHHHIGTTELGISDRVNKLQLYVAHLRQANSGLVEEMKKFQSGENAVDILCNDMEQMINQLITQVQIDDNENSNADGILHDGSLSNDNSDESVEEITGEVEQYILQGDDKHADQD